MTNRLTVIAPEGQPTVSFEREFDAPVTAVFEAYRDPELIKKWLGPAGYDMEIDEYDFVSGGRYRYIHRSPEGEEYAFRGTFHTVRENEFAVQTFEFEGFRDVVSLDTMWFDDLGDGRSGLRGASVFPSVEARDGMVASGMETGMSEGYEKLEGLLITA